MLAQHSTQDIVDSPDLQAQFSALTHHYSALAKSNGFEGLYTRCDPEVGLYAIIAIHSTQRGPAIGGCRCISYTLMQDAFEDAMRLGQAMSYKSALHHLPHGGAKAVLIRPAVIHNRQAYFQAFADFVESLEGRYLTSLDSGTETTDMDIISTHTEYVLGTTQQQIDPADSPSPYTALGVYKSIEAMSAYLSPKRALTDLRVCVQGVGHVGRLLTERLHAAGAHITVSDIDPDRAEFCRRHLGVDVVPHTQAHQVDCDIYSPCALGSVLNHTTIPELNCNAIVGAANNQLSDHLDALALQKRNILYAPDFLVSGGGLIHVASIYHDLTHDVTQSRINAIAPRLTQILMQAKKENRSPHQIACAQAEMSLSDPIAT